MPELAAGAGFAGYESTASPARAAWCGLPRPRGFARSPRRTQADRRRARGRPQVPQTLPARVERALAKDPDERYQTAGEFARAARDALSGTPPPPPDGAHTPRPAARLLRIVLPVLLVLGLIAAALAALGVV